MGCNAWASTSNLVGAPAEFITYSPTGAVTDSDVYLGTVTTDASLNTYLNGEYYSNTLGTDKKYTVSSNFYVGCPGNDSDDTDDIATNVNQEKQYTWNGKVGLISLTEYMKASIDSTCTTINSSWGSNNRLNCGKNNWLNIGHAYWLINPFPNTYRINVYRVYAGGHVANGGVNSSSGVLPVTFLSSNIHLSGTGEQGANAYKIVE